MKRSNLKIEFEALSFTNFLLDGIEPKIQKVRHDSPRRAPYRNW